MLDDSDLDDLLGETMLLGWRRCDAIPLGDPARQRVWLFTIAAHELANDRRALRRRTALADQLHGHGCARGRRGLGRARRPPRAGDARALVLARRRAG